MRIAVCDDCMEDALSLKKYLDGQEVSIYSDAESLLADVEGTDSLTCTCWIFSWRNL